MEINLLDYFTFKRFTNAVKIVTSYQISRIVNKPVVWGMPMSFSIEPTNRCNLECPECPSGLGALTRELGLLSFENFKNWIDQIKTTGFYVQLYFQGEPFINKDLPKMLNYAREQNVYTSISTNGLLLNEKNIDTLLENPPDKLIFFYRWA
ncbi:MAG: radical SAM protein [Ignavibacteriales bacterium]|nr:radical SAM protein [Ignavibacteriales bacterium]